MVSRFSGVIINWYYLFSMLFLVLMREEGHYEIGRKKVGVYWPLCRFSLGFVFTFILLGIANLNNNYPNSNNFKNIIRRHTNIKLEIF